MNLVKDTIELVKQQAILKANASIKMKNSLPISQGEFWQGQYQAFSEMVTMLEQMQKIR